MVGHVPRSPCPASATGFQLPDGSWSYMMANCAGAAKKVAVVNAALDGPKKLDAYKVTEALIPSDRAVRGIVAAPLVRSGRLDPRPVFF